MLPLTVVIVDDHPGVLRTLRFLLENEPALNLIGEASDGLEAIRAVHRLKPDLLLLDINMPQMTGLEVLQYLRNEKNPLLVIFFSNHAETVYLEAAKRLGASAFVDKASGVDGLMTAIHALTCNVSPLAA